MFGLITEIKTKSDKRDELIRILMDGTRDMAGCLSYVVAKDAARDDALWITEIWKDQASHAKSLKLPSVQTALAKGRPLITLMGTRAETLPVNI